MERSYRKVESKLLCSNGQYYVVVRNRKEYVALLRYLEENDYKAVHRFFRRKRPKRPPVVVVDEKRWEYAYTNVTCLAAAASCGYRAIGTSEFFGFMQQKKAKCPFNRTTENGQFNKKII